MAGNEGAADGLLLYRQLALFYFQQFQRFLIVILLLLIFRVGIDENSGRGTVGMTKACVNRVSNKIRFLT